MISIVSKFLMRFLNLRLWISRNTAGQNQVTQHKIWDLGLIWQHFPAMPRGFWCADTQNLGVCCSWSSTACYWNSSKQISRVSVVFSVCFCILCAEGWRFLGKQSCLPSLPVQQFSVSAAFWNLSSPGCAEGSEGFELIPTTARAEADFGVKLRSHKSAAGSSAALCLQTAPLKCLMKF